MGVRGADMQTHATVAKLLDKDKGASMTRETLQLEIHICKNDLELEQKILKMRDGETKFLVKQTPLVQARKSRTRYES